MRTTAQAKRLKDARRRTIARRGELPTATPPVVVSRAFLKRLKEQDPKLELFWHPLLERFLLYSKIWGGSHRQPDDLLVMELDLGEKPPGDWLVDWLKFNDKYAGGAVNPKQARRNYLQGLEDHEDRRLGYWDKLRMEMSEDVAKHLAWCINRRSSFTVDWGKRRYA